MNMRCRRMAMVAALGVAARADDMWLRPERVAATPGATLEFRLARAADFNGPGIAVPPARIAVARGRLAGEDVALVAPISDGKAPRLTATLPRPGVAVPGVELKPRVLDLAPAEVESRLRELHAGDALREAWAATAESRRWREACVENAKTFVRVGEPVADDRAWALPLGLRLEIVPERDPTTLRAGDPLPVRVLRAGAPLAGLVLGFVSEGGTREHIVVTDGEGRARAVLDVRGAWLVRGTELRRATAAGLEWESDVATMVVEVQ